MKKIVSLVLALTMLAGLSTTAMAASSRENRTNSAYSQMSDDFTAFVNRLPKGMQKRPLAFLKQYFLFEQLFNKKQAKTPTHSFNITLASDSVVSVMHFEQDSLEFAVPQHESSVKDGYEFLGYYCTDTGKTYQIGETIPVGDFTENNGEYSITLTATFKPIQQENPDITYTDAASYHVTVNIVSPEDEIGSMFTITDNVTSLDESVTMTRLPSTLTRGVYKVFDLVGFRSLVTGHTFYGTGPFALKDLAPAVQNDVTLDDETATRTTNYEINDKLVPIFNYYGVEGTFNENHLQCTVNYYITDEITNGDDLNAGVTTIDTQTFTIAMNQWENALPLNCATDMEGYTFEGYSLLTDTAVTYPDGKVPLADFGSNDGHGHLTFAIKLHYSADETASPEA